MADLRMRAGGRMSRTLSEVSKEWHIGPVPGLGLRRDTDGHLVLPLAVARYGKHLALAPLALTVVEAEQLHAALCYALGGEPAPEDAPECRKPVRYAGGRQRY
ncbi:hypothetical protein ACFRNT_21910 [Streptomyces sp. NPDC056697]|uniref:hypothetical protein n=1 Tax=Streptomyces sp. NPDC056697 TaxID=3345915 RepID=UPI0036AD3923